MSIRFLLLALTVFLAGCSVTKTHSFDGHDADSVWTAMLVVAKSPAYNTGDPADRWNVRENRVWADEEQNRIEIFRRLDRILYQPASKPRYEDREWRFQVALEQRDPPTVSFSSREVGLPSHAWEEADRFFDEVWDMLGGKRIEPELPPDPVEALPDSGDRYDN